MFMLRSVLRSVLLFLVFGNLSVGYTTSHSSEERPLLVGQRDFKKFTRQQWCEVSLRDSRLIEEASEYYRSNPSKLEAVQDLFLSGWRCCRPSIPAALREIILKAQQIHQISPYVSPKIHTVVVPGVQTILHEAHTEGGTSLRRSELERTLPDQMSQLELFRTQIRSEMAGLVETEVDRRVETLTQTIRQQQEELGRLREALDAFGEMGTTLTRLQGQISEAQVGTGVIQDSTDSGLGVQIEMLTQKNTELEELLRKFTRVVLTLKDMAPGDAYKAKFAEKFGQK